MAKVTITDTNGRVTEISDISFDEARQLLSTNGHAGKSVRAYRKRKQVSPMPDSGAGPNYVAFMQNLSPNGKKFIEILKENRNGILADDLAEKLGFKSTNQIGGVTGGGMGKLATKFRIDLSTIYTADIQFENGQRRTTYKPGSAVFAHAKPA